MKIELFFIVKTFPNGRTRIMSGPYYSHMDALIAKDDEFRFFPSEKDYRIARTEIEMELV